MLDIAIALANGKAHVRNTRVVLKVDELLGAAIRVFVRRHAPQRLAMV